MTAKDETKDETFDKTIKRVAVIGGNNAGKTVFLTAMIDNLMNNRDREKFDLGAWSVLETTLSDSGKYGFERFPYELYHAKMIGLGNGHAPAKWPEKTLGTSISRMIIRLRRSEISWFKRIKMLRGKRKTVSLEFVDVAGERIADFGMIDSDFKEWSRKTNNGLDGVLACWKREAEGIYEDWRKQESRQIDDVRKKFIDGYKDILCRLYSSGANVAMTPSTVRITESGKVLDDRNPEEYKNNLQDNSVGLEGKDFTPLPDIVFEDSERDGQLKSLVDDFKSHYDEYKQKVVQPLWDYLKHVNSIVYLVDVLGILADGVAAYNSEVALAQSCFDDVFRNRCILADTWLKRLREKRKAKKKCQYYSRLSIVATKADILDGDRCNLISLLQEMFENLVGKCGFDSVGYFYCASVKSEKNNGMSSKADDDEGGECPEKWKDDWQAGCYKFNFEVSPPRRSRNGTVMENINLAGIAKVILDID